jgi:elongation factor Ts
MAVTAGMVKDLREKTGAGMMDCKAALGETQGDIEAAVDWLRKKGLAKAAKKAGRTAAEGLVGVESPGRSAAMVEINSETDFVARNDSFQAFVREATKVALMVQPSVDALEAAHMPGSSTSLKDKIQELVATIGENMTIRRVAKLEVHQGVVATYVHNQVSDGLGKIGVIVALESGADVGELSALGRQIAAHVAAMNPVAVDASGVDPAVVERESAILREKNAGKPDSVLAKDRRERAEELLQGEHAPRSGLRLRAIEVGRADAEGCILEGWKAGRAEGVRPFRTRRRHREGRERFRGRGGGAIGNREEAGRRPRPSVTDRGGLKAAPFRSTTAVCAGFGSEEIQSVTTPYGRVLVKLSGEALAAPDGYWLYANTLADLAADVAATAQGGTQLAIVIGGGNIIRGARMSQAGWIDRPTADSMGMLATVMNSLALETALNAAGVSARTMSAVSMPTICETYARQPALHYLERGQVVVLAGGTGKPVLHDRYGGGAASCGAALRRGAEGDPGGRRLFGGSEDRSWRRALRPDHA